MEAYLWFLERFYGTIQYLKTDAEFALAKAESLDNEEEKLAAKQFFSRILDLAKAFEAYTPLRHKINDMEIKLYQVYASRKNLSISTSEFNKSEYHKVTQETTNKSR